MCTGSGRPWARAGQVLGAIIAGLGVAEAFAYQYLDGLGLWLILIGWFLITAAGAEGRASAARAALAGLRAPDAMTPHPELAFGWHSVAEFIDQAARSRQEAFPVVGFDGQLTGIVRFSR